MKIRRATKRDAETVASLNRIVQQIHADAHPDIFKPVSEGFLTTEQVEVWLADPKKMIYLGEEGGEPIGYLFLEIMDHPETVHSYAQKSIHIHHLSVNPGCRRKGYGAQLIGKTEEVARELSIDRITLSVWQFNERAQRFFSSQGFLPYNIRMWKKSGEAIIPMS